MKKLKIFSFFCLFLVLFGVFAFAQQLDPVAPLREARKTAADIDLATKFVVFLLSLAIFVVSVGAYFKSKSKRFVFVALAFFFFAFKWGLKILDLFLTTGDFLTDPVQNVFELIILVSLIIAIFKK